MTRDERAAISILNAYKEGYESAIEDYKQEPCDDAVSRKLAIRAIKNLYPDIPRVDFNGAKRKWADKYAQYIECERLIEQLPSVNPQKSGKWIKTISENGITSAVRCSECGFEDNRYMLFRYCPNCGAKMVEPQESEDKE